MSRFQVVMEMENGMQFNVADTPEKVDEFVDEFGVNKDYKAVKVYRFNQECGTYRLVFERNRDSEKRMIGFGRW